MCTTNVPALVYGISKKLSRGFDEYQEALFVASSELGVHPDGFEIGEQLLQLFEGLVLICFASIRFECIWVSRGFRRRAQGGQRATADGPILLNSYSITYLSWCVTCCWGGRRGFQSGGGGNASSSSLSLGTFTLIQDSVAVAGGPIRQLHTLNWG